MKKLTKIILFSLAGVLVIGISIFILICCLQKDTFTKKSYIIVPDSSLHSITIQVTDREVDINTSTDNQIYIEYYDSTKEYLDIRFSESDTCTIQLLHNKNWMDFIRVKPSATYRKIKIALPKTLVVHCSVSTTGADIKINAVSYKTLNLNTNGGNILCNKVSVDTSISLTAKNGNISGTIIGSWDDFAISCSIKKGHCNLPLYKEDGSKSLVANCNNGNINIQFV